MCQKKPHIVSTSGNVVVDIVSLVSINRDFMCWPNEWIDAEKNRDRDNSVYSIYVQCVCVLNSMDQQRNETKKKLCC